MRARVLTALALIPPVLAAVFCTESWPLILLGLILIGLASGELDRLIKGRFALLGSLLMIGVGLSMSYIPGRGMVYEGLVLMGIGAFLVGVIAVWQIVRTQQPRWYLEVLTSGWVAGPILGIVGLHLLSSGPTPPWFKLEMPLLLAIVPLWAGDTAAIFAGKTFGKHKLAPTISPKKTVEGGIANLIACVLAAWGLGAWLKFPLPVSLVCGFAAGILGQMGDLFESWIKRRADLKDSGTLLPGHGGILDRVDSILFTAPVVAALLIFWPN